MTGASLRHTSTRLVLGGAALVALASAARAQAPPLEPADTPSRAEVEDRISQERIRRLRAYEEWNENRRADYVRLREFRAKSAGAAATTPPAAIDPVTLVRLRDYEIPEGIYTLPTVAGQNARVEVIRGEVTGEGIWSRSEYDYAAYLAAQVARRLREIDFHLQRTATRGDLRPQLAIVRSAIGALQTSLTNQDPLDTVRREHVAFESDWTPLSKALAETAVRDARLRRLIELTDEADRNLQLVVSVAPGPVYDRLRVVALAQQLVTSTQKLDDGLQSQEDDRPTWLHSRLRNLAEDVRKSAARLLSLVSDNAPFQEVAAQYEDFDMAWHRLTDRAIQGPIKTPLGNAEDIWYIDRTLRKLLRVQPAFVSPQQRTASALTELQDDTAALGRALEALRAEKATTDASDAEFATFAAAVDTLRESMIERAAADVIRSNMETVALDWAPFRRDFLRTNPPEPLQELVKRIDEDIRTLPTPAAAAEPAPAARRTAPPPPARP